MRDEILAARALVLPSFAEGLPVVIMEAMALRRPVISTFVAGIPELVHPGEHGWLVPAGDVEALAHAMQVCLDAPADVLIRMGEAAHKRALAHHLIDTQAAYLATLFNAAIERKRNFSNSAQLQPDKSTDVNPIVRGDSIEVQSRFDQTAPRLKHDCGIGHSRPAPGRSVRMGEQRAGSDGSSLTA